MESLKVMLNLRNPKVLEILAVIQQMDRLLREKLAIGPAQFFLWEVQDNYYEESWIGKEVGVEFSICEEINVKTTPFVKGYRSFIRALGNSGSSSFNIRTDEKGIYPVSCDGEGIGKSVEFIAGQLINWGKAKAK